MLLHGSAVDSFTLQSGSPLYEFIKSIFSFTCWWTFELFPALTIKMKLLQTFAYNSLHGHIHSFTLSKSLRVEWVSYMVGICLIFRNLSNCFPHLCYWTFPLSAWQFQFLYIFENSRYFPFLVLVILVHVQRYVIMS